MQTLALCVWIVLPLAVWCQGVAPCPADPVRSQFCALVKVVNGQFALAPGSTVTMVPGFAAGLEKGTTVAEAQEAIRQGVTAEMAALPKIYLAGLADGENDASLTDAVTNGLRTFTGTWMDYAAAYTGWQSLVPGRQDAGDVFGRALSGLLQPGDGAILNDLLEDPSSSYISFSVLDPFASKGVTIELPGMAAGRKKKRDAEIREHLRGLDGKLWSDAAIRGALAPLYTNLGLTPTIQVFVREEKISIIEGPRFSSIVLPPEVPEGAIDGILWNLLTTTEFRRAMTDRGRWIGGRTLLYQDLGHAKGDEPYVVQYDLQVKQLLLSQQGYTMTLQPSRQQGANQYFDLRVQKAGSDTGGAAKPQADAEGIDRQGLARADREMPKAEKIGQGVEAPDKSEDKDKPRRIGAELTYKPGQGIGVAGLFQASRIPWPFANGTGSVSGGGPTGGVITGNYFVDFLGFPQIHQRIAMRLNGSQAVTLHRYLAGQKVDETDTGGRARVEWEPFRDWNGGDLRIWMDAGRTTVKLASNTKSIATQNQTTTEFGAAYYMNSVEAEYPQRTVIQPKVKVGLGASATEQPFAHATLVATHRRSFDAWQYSLAGRVETATRGTPLFEQPSFGGAEVVRGFRADDALGLRLWSLQSELLHPVPGLDAAGLTNAQIRQLVSGLRLACFYDVGGAYQTTGSAPGERMGVGMGLHIDMKLAELKFDWAYGLGNAATGGAKGKFYFGIQLNIPQ
jgi:hypothetical protein